MGESPFDKLFTKSVPNILEEIFFSLDYASFKKCTGVNRAWHELLTSESFKRIGKSTFREDIEKELWLALFEGNAIEVRRVLSSGMVDVNGNKKSEMTPLFFAAKKGLIDVVQLLLEEGAEPNHGSLDKWKYIFFTPLHASAIYGRLEVAKLLLKGGANIDMEDRLKETPIYHTPLHYAVMQGHKDLVRFLLEKGAEPNKANIGGETPLHYASFFGNPANRKDIVQLLIENGADLKKRNNSGRTPLGNALMRGQTDIVNLIRENGGT